MTYSVNLSFRLEVMKEGIHEREEYIKQDNYQTKYTLYNYVMLICPKNIEIIKKERSLNNEYV